MNQYWAMFIKFATVAPRLLAELQVSGAAAGAVDAVRDAHVVLEIVTVLEGTEADAAGLSILLLIGVNVLDVAFKTAPMQEFAAIYARSLLAWKTNNKKNNLQKLCSSEWNSKCALLNTKNDSIMTKLVH
jgi:hypothetical protein